MNNNSRRQHDQLDNCSWYMLIASSRHQLSSLLLAELEVYHSHEMRTLHVYSASILVRPTLVFHVVTYIYCCCCYDCS